MLLQSVTKYDENGNVRFKQSFNVFSVEDKGNGIARGQLSCGKRPYEQSRADQALINAGYKLDTRGFIRGSFYVAFRGNAYEKVLSLKNGAIIEDVLFDNDPYPYVNNNGEIKYRNEPQYIVIDFNVKSFDNNEQDSGSDVDDYTDPFTNNDPISPAYIKKEPKKVEEEDDTVELSDY